MIEYVCYHYHGLKKDFRGSLQVFFLLSKIIDPKTETEMFDISRCAKILGIA